MRNLDDYVVPIPTGLRPADRGGLSPERAAALDRRLAELSRARIRAWAEIRAEGYQ